MTTTHTLETAGADIAYDVWAVSSYRPDVDALAGAPTRIVVAVGEESQPETFARKLRDVLRQD